MVSCGVIYSLGTKYVCNGGVFLFGRSFLEGRVHAQFGAKIKACPPLIARIDPKIDRMECKK